MNELPPPWRIVSDTQHLDSDWRNLVVVGPGILKPSRKYWLAFNTRTKRFKETDCMKYMRKQDPNIVRAVGRVVRSTQPRWRRF